MYIFITVAIILQTLTLLYLKFGVNKGVPAEIPDASTEPEYVSAIESSSKPLIHELNEIKNDAADADKYFNKKIADLTSVVDGLAEHVDGILDIVTSIAADQEESKSSTIALTARLSRVVNVLDTTKELLDRTIDSIDWDDDVQSPQSLPTVYDTAASVQAQRPYVPPVPPVSPTRPAEGLPVPPKAPTAPVQPAEIEPPVTEVPLVAVRGDNDPLITDLRAEPFRDDPNAYEDPHALPMSAEYEVMGTGRGHGRRSSRTNGLRNRF